jgi:hypothetical protein
MDPRDVVDLQVIACLLAAAITQNITLILSYSAKYRLNFWLMFEFDSRVVRGGPVK